MIDVLVAGGGPAGLATAIHAALAGMEAVVVEPRTAPVDKACGEGLMPGGVAALAAMGVHPAGRRLRGIHYLDGRHQARAAFGDADGLGVRRTVLHAALARRAAELGVTTVTGRVRDIRQDRDGVEAAGLRARWLVAADGLHSPARRSLGLDLPARGPRRYGLRAHFRVAPWTDFVEVHWSGEGGEAYVTPVADDLVGVAVLTSRRRPYHEQLAAFPALLARLRAAREAHGAAPALAPVVAPVVEPSVVPAAEPVIAAEGHGAAPRTRSGAAGPVTAKPGTEEPGTADPVKTDRATEKSGTPESVTPEPGTAESGVPERVTAVLGAGPLRRRVRARVAGRVLLVGDAAGYTDALTGEGVSLAVRCAEVLVGCLQRDRPQDYEHAWRRLSRTHRLLTGALVHAAHRPATARLVVPAAHHMPALFTAIVRALA
ncbi:NAD(P)/FAD-dependent oxidoreductase [Nonomuraea indica]|uniref:NAD(P)/FAD-dependent oxidoreductase n=1 Tax=Nonomuraea indica TaxID=1581193 RepID=UPI000C7A671C|nr:FAD-dependent monooxygenase [Nonomuraea indica]